MHDLGKMLVALGSIVVIIGVILWKTGGLGGFGRWPGDIWIQKGNSTFYFPVATCLVISIVLSLLVWLVRK